MDDVVKGFLFGLLVSCFVLGLGFVSAEETPVSWFNDTIYNDSCVVLKSDQYSYMRLDNQPVVGQLKIINSCGKEFPDVRVIFYGASGGKISLVKLDKVDGVKEVPVEVKKTDTTVTTHRVLADAVNANKLELKVETPVNVEGVIDLASVAIMTKVVDKEILDREIKSLDLVSSEEGTLTIGTGVTYYNFTIQPEQESGEFAIELKGLSILDPTYYSYDGNIITGGVYNPGFEYGTGSTGTSEWIGDANYGWRTESVSATNGVIVSFDTTIKNTGLQSLKIISDNNRIRITNIGSTSTISLLNEKPWTMIPVKPSTNYNLCYSTQINTNDGNGLTLLVSGVSSTFATANPTFNQLTPKQSVSFVRQCTPVITSSTTKYLRILFYSGFDSASNNTGTSYLDNVRLEEVHNYNLTSQAVGVPSITITGVTDTNVIDQADTNNSTTMSFGSDISYNTGECFTPTQSKLTGITIQKGGATGTFTGDVIVTLRDYNVAGFTPGTKILARTTIANATWNALTNQTDYFVALPAILDANGTNHYCFDLNSSTHDALNYTRIYGDTNNSYSGGTRISHNGTTWSYTSGNATADIYFKTHFAKLSSSTDMNVVNADGSSTNFVLNMPEILTDANITIRPDGTGSLRYKPVYRGSTSGFKWNYYSDFYDWNLIGSSTSDYMGFVTSNGLALSSIGNTFYSVTNRIYAPRGCTFTGNAVYTPNLVVAATRYFYLQHSNDNATWLTDANWTADSTTPVNMYVDGNNIFYVKLLNGSSTTYMRNAQIDANFTCTGINYPRFEFGDNNTLIMQTNDYNWANTGDVINKTPSMMQKMYYTFDKPTTNITTTSHPTLNNTRLITLTCETNQDWQTCNKTYYSTNGTTYTEYTNPITIQTETPIYYYSTTTNGDTETTNTTTITITPQLSTGTCGLTQLLFLAITGLILIAILFILVQNFSIETLIAFIPIIIIIIISMMLSQSIVSIVCIA